MVPYIEHLAYNKALSHISKGGKKKKKKEEIMANNKGKTTTKIVKEKIEAS